MNNHNEKYIHQVGKNKIRLYCQVCQKQCKDDHGFDAHCNSDRHKRMIELLGEHPEDILGRFSHSFETKYLSLLMSKYPNQIIDANQLYNEYLEDSNNVLINSTKWISLASFVLDCSERGLFKSYKKEKGFDIIYAHDDDISDGESKHKKKKYKEDNGIFDKINKIPIQQEPPKPPPKEFSRIEGQVISFNLNSKKELPKINAPISHTEPELIIQEEPKKKKELFIDECMKSFQKSNIPKKKTPAPIDMSELSWIIEGIYVKIVEPGDFNQMKGIITKIPEQFIAEVKVEEVTIRIDQHYLETVIPVYRLYSQ